MSYFEAVLETLQGIQKEMKATRHAILHQTKLLQETAENPTSAIKKTNKPKEAAPAPKTITWQEALRTLRDLCKDKSPGECNPTGCPVWPFCERYLQGGGVPETWEVPGDE